MTVATIITALPLKRMVQGQFAAWPDDFINAPAPAPLPVIVAIAGPQGPIGPQGPRGPGGMYSANVGNGVLTTFTLNHNLGTRDVVVSMQLTNDNSMIIADWVAVDINNITATFAQPPGLNAVRIIVIG